MCVWVCVVCVCVCPEPAAPRKLERSADSQQATLDAIEELRLQKMASLSGVKTDGGKPDRERDRDRESKMDKHAHFAPEPVSISRTTSAISSRGPTPSGSPMPPPDDTDDTETETETERLTDGDTERDGDRALKVASFSRTQSKDDVRDRDDSDSVSDGKFGDEIKTPVKPKVAVQFSAKRDKERKDLLAVSVCVKDCFVVCLSSTHTHIYTEHRHTPHTHTHTGSTAER